MTSVLLLAGTALPFVISPGASFTITVTSVANGDRLSPLKVWAGTAGGIGILAMTAGLTDVGRLVAASPRAQLLLSVAGGCTLIVFGTITLLRARRHHQPAATATATDRGRSTRLVLWSAIALITNVKALTLYVLVVPTINVGPNDGLGLYIAFAAVHVTMLLAWLVFIGVAMHRTPAMRSNRARRALALLGATVMVILGAYTVAAALI